MRIRVVGTGIYSHVNAEYDILLSTPVMNVKVRIMNQFSIQPSEQQFTYKGIEIKNMECILNCGIQPGEHIVLAPTQHLIPVNMHYGKDEIKVEVKPTATILGLKNLLYTKTQQKIDINRLVAVFEDTLVKDTTMISTLPTISSKPIYFTYPELQFNIHMMEESTFTLSKPYSCTVGVLRESISNISHEDPNLLVLEQEGTVIDVDDTIPLYQTSFIESNTIQVTFLSITELIRRVRNLERKEKEQELTQNRRQQLVEKWSEITRHNDITLQQLKIAIDATAVKQEQQLDNLIGTLNMLKERVDIISPRFEEINELRKTNRLLEARIEEITKHHSRDSISTETESALTQMQSRVSELEKRINHLTATSRRVVSPPPLPSSAIPKMNDIISTEQMEEDHHFMPKLRKAFAAPKLPSFVLKALHGKNRPPVNDLVCTLPPYAKM